MPDTLRIKHQGGKQGEEGHQGNLNDRIDRHPVEAVPQQRILDRPDEVGHTGKSLPTNHLFLEQSKVKRINHRNYGSTQEDNYIGQTPDHAYMLKSLLAWTRLTGGLRRHDPVGGHYGCAHH